MTGAALEIAKDPAGMREAERTGFAPQVRNFIRQADKEHVREKGRGLRRMKGLSGKASL